MSYWISSNIAEAHLRRLAIEAMASLFTNQKKSKSIRLTILTDRKIKSLKARDQRYIEWEGNRHGIGTLGVRVSPHGRKSWIFMYKDKSTRKARMVTLGTYPKLTLASANVKATEMMEKVEAGKDPATQHVLQQRERRLEPTLRELSEDYLEIYAKKHKLSWRNDEQMLNKDILPFLGDIKASEVRRRDIIETIERVAERAPVAANRCLGIIRRMYNWAVEREIVVASPAWHVKNPSKEKARIRTLTDDEIKTLWHLLNADRKDVSSLPDNWPSRIVRLSIKLALLTAQRRGEIISAKIIDFDLENGWWTIPAECTKTKLNNHRVYLAKTTIDIIHEIISINKDSASNFLFPSPRYLDQPMDPHAISTAIIRIRNYSKIDNWSLHDLRRTAASKMAEFGIQRLVISKILNHTDQTITAIYERYSYDNEKRDALTMWEKQLSHIVK